MAQSQFNIASAGETGASTLHRFMDLEKYMNYNKSMSRVFVVKWYLDAEWITKNAGK